MNPPALGQNTALQNGGKRPWAAQMCLVVCPQGSGGHKALDKLVTSLCSLSPETLGTTVKATASHEDDRSWVTLA